MDITPGGGHGDYSGSQSSSSDNEGEYNEHYAPSQVRNVQFERTTYLQQVNKGCECNSDCVKYWAFVVSLFVVYYACLGLLIWGLMELVAEDSQVVLGVYGGLFLATVIGIVILILWGHFTDQLGKMERKAEERTRLVLERKKRERGNQV